MEVFTASGQELTSILGASGSLIQASFGSILDSANLIGTGLNTLMLNSANLIDTGLNTLLNGLLIPSMGYMPFSQWLVYYVDDVLLTPFLDVNAPQNPLVLDGFLLS
jgi:hypothetical protein